MERLSEISLFLLLLVVTITMARERENSNADLAYPTEPVDCISEVDYKNISSQNTKNISDNILAGFADIKTDLMKVNTKEDLENSNNLINENIQNINKSLGQITVTLGGLATIPAVENLQQLLLNMKSDITNESKEISNLVNETTKNVIESVNKHFDLNSVPITEELSAIKNQTIVHFHFLNETLTSLATESAVVNIVTEMNKLPTVDIITSILQDLPNKTDLNLVSSAIEKFQTNAITNFQNITDHLDNQLSSLTQEYKAIKELIMNIQTSFLSSADKSPLPSTVKPGPIERLHTNENNCNVTEDLHMLFNKSRIELKTDLSDKYSKLMASIREIKELLKTQKNDEASNVAGQDSNQPSKQSFEKSDIFGILSIVALLVLFVVLCVLMKRVGNMQDKLQHIQMQVAHERYYQRDSPVRSFQNEPKHVGQV
ncbi:unnamed protein product, partial [Meganyctiphanes norvegica]